MFNDTRILFTIITLIIIVFCFSSIVNYYRVHNTDTIIRSNSVIASLRSNPFKNKKVINLTFKNDKSKKSKIYVKLNNHNFLEYTPKLYNVITIYNQTISRNRKSYFGCFNKFTIYSSLLVNTFYIRCNIDIVVSAFKSGHRDLKIKNI